MMIYHFRETEHKDKVHSSYHIYVDMMVKYEIIVKVISYICICKILHKKVEYYTHSINIYIYIYIFS